MAKETRKAVLDWVFHEEGGYAERKTEPGGAVNMGISFDEFCRYCEANKLPVPHPGAGVSFAEVSMSARDFEPLKAMPREVAEIIYNTQFLRPVRYDELPAGIDYCVLDFAINSGISGALRAIRREFGLPEAKPSWKIEPALMERLEVEDPAVAAEEIAADVTRICEARLRVMKSSDSWGWAHRGWVPRLDRVRTRSKLLAREVPLPAPEGNAKAIPPRGAKV